LALLRDVPLFKSNQGHQRTKHPIDCLPTILMDLDTSNAWFWMVMKRIHGLNVYFVWGRYEVFSTKNN
jgi:hypothetical protein